MTLHYQLDGPEDAPVLVLSNSMGTTTDLWQPQMAALSARFRVLRYDTHGHGKTRKRGSVSLAQLGEDVIGLLDRLNIEKAFFCGISVGGLTGLWLARFAPDRFHALAVANTAAKIGEPAGWLERARAVREKGLDDVAAGTAGRWFTPDFCQRSPETVAALIKTLAQQDPEGYAEGCEALAHADLRAEIGAIRAPLLVIAGEHDPVTTVADADFLHQHVSGSREVILPASHLSNVEAPAAFSAALLDFFKEYQ